jgi:hypothetical protein
MADGIIQVPPDSTGKLVDTSEITVAGQSVERQRIVIASNTGSATFATILSSGPVGTEGGLVVRNIPSGTQEVNGQISLAAGTANIGFINNISATVSVAVPSGLALNASTANIGTLNNISATVTVAGNIGLAAGSNNIGIVNNISATVSVVVGAGTANMGGVSLVAGTSNIGFINHISQTVVAALAAGGNNIGYINNISATVVTGLSYVVEKTSNSQVQVGDSANAAIRVNIVAGAAGGVSQIDGTTFSSQAANFVPAGGIFDDVGTDTLSENDAGIVRMTTNRAFHMNLRTDGGAKMEDSANTALRVNIVAGGGSGGTSQADGTSFTAQNALFTPIGGVFDDAASDTLSENDAGIVRMTTNRAFHVNLRDTTGAQIGDTSATGLFIRTATVAFATGAIVNNISATVIVAGVVGITAGTAVIGDINAISRTVQVAIGTPFTVNNISATISVVVGAGTANMGAVSLAAGTSNIGFINNISATIAAVLAAGSANIGTINNISATVSVALSQVKDLTSGSAVVVGDSANSAIRVNIVADVFATAVTAVMSGSHGPKMVVASTSANVTLITGPGAGLSVYITQLACSNRGADSTLARAGTSASVETVAMWVMSAGGGFVMNFDPPWKLSASEAALCSVKPNSTGNVYFNVNFYVAV